MQTIKILNLVLLLAFFSWSSLGTTGPFGKKTVATSADVQLSLSALDSAALYVSSEPRADVVEVVEIEIPIGDPVSLRVLLENVGDTLSTPITPLGHGLRNIPLRITVTCPDGRVLEVPWARRGGCRMSNPHPLPLEPGQSYTLDIYVFEIVERNEHNHLEWDYVFTLPGRYLLEAKYLVGDPTEFAGWESNEEGEAPATTTSNTVTVDVVEPAIPGWNELIAHDVLQYAGKSRWQALQKQAATVMDLVEAAGRLWFSEWVESLQD